MMTQKNNDQALSEVIGFVLILALITTALSLWVVYVVPSQGREMEIAHMDGVMDRFVNYKMALDSVWLNGQSGVTDSTTFTLGSQGGDTQAGGLFLPLMKPVGSPASLAVNNTGDSITITTSDPLKNVSVPLSKLSYQSYNNYWIQQEYYYQMGGVFLSQEDGVTCRVSPPVSIYNASNIANVVVAPVRLNGGILSKYTISGEGNARVDSRLTEQPDYVLSGTYDWVNISLNVDCHAARMWENLLKGIVVRENIPVTWYTNSSVSDCGSSQTERRVVFMNITGPPTGANDVTLGLKRADFYVTLNNFALLGVN